MYHFSAFTVALSLALSASSLVVPRATPPAGWNTPLLEPYDTYHTRYMALSCETKHNTAFFDQCCHPLLATQSLTKDRPSQCNPAASSSAAPAAKPSSTSSDDGDDDDLPFCDDDDDDGDDSTHVSSSPAKVAAPETTHAASPVTTHPAVTVAPPPPKPTTSAKPAPAKPVATPSTNSATSSVQTGGFATFFFQNGVAGACGTVHKDTDMIAAIDEARYGFSGAKSSLCGKQVKITNTKNQKTVTVTIADDCPTCANSNSIDLSQGAFERIATVEEGMVPITWQFL